MMKKRSTMVGGALFLAAIAGASYAVIRARSLQGYSVPEDLHFFNSSSGLPVLVGEDVSNYVSWAVPGDRIVYGMQEYNPASQSWEYQEFVYTTSYQILDVAARAGGRELFISGVQIVGTNWNDIVEKWTFPRTKGSYIGTMSPPFTVRGEPRPPFQGSVHIQGGAYIAQSQRSGIPGVPLQPIPSKAVLYMGADYHHFDDLQVDPEGRFLLLHSYGLGSLYSIDLSGPSQPMVEYSSTEIPHLSLVRSGSVRDHPTLGRIYYLSEKNKYGEYAAGAPGVITCLIDDDNDGFFDSFQNLAEYDIAVGTTILGDPTEWDDPVNHGWDWREDLLGD